jgi:hypothetical protein
MPISGTFTTSGDDVDTLVLNRSAITDMRFGIGSADLGLISHRHVLASGDQLGYNGFEVFKLTGGSGLKAEHTTGQRLIAGLVPLRLFQALLGFNQTLPKFKADWPKCALPVGGRAMSLVCSNQGHTRLPSALTGQRLKRRRTTLVGKDRVPPRGVARR